MAEWDVARSSGHCNRCDAELTEGQEYYAALLETPEGFERQDFCQACWDEQPAERFCFWKSRMPVREQKRTSLLVDDAVLINFFERLERETDPVRVRFRFVLALILMRKRLLRYEETVRKGDAEIWQMRLTGTSSVHEVVNPKLSDEEITEVSGQLGVILRGNVAGDPGGGLDLHDSAGDGTAGDLPSEASEGRTDADTPREEHPAR